MNVNSVTRVFAKQDTLGVMKKFSMGKSFMNVESVRSWKLKET